MLGIRTVGDLNEVLMDGDIDALIRTAEAVQEKRISRLADRISEQQTVKWIFLAGPSSAGKTTVAKRLAIQLRVNGLRCVTLSVAN